MTDYNKRFLENKFKNKYDKEKLINNIIRDFQDYQNTLSELKSLRRESDALKKALKTKCDNDKENKLNYEDMLLNSEKYSNIKARILELENLRNKIRLNYKIALIQRKNIYDNVCKNISEYKKAKSIIVLKSQYIGSIINRIQISIIFVSSTITLFESIKSNFIIPVFYLTLIPIVLSTYIAIILAISRFYKFDTKKESIKKVEEKYSYIINRLRYKRRKVINFDFACEKLNDWNILIENFNKDGLEEMITKTIEESDSLLTLKEYTYYHSVYNKIKTKNSIHQFNSDLLENWENLNSVKIDNRDKVKQGIVRFADTELRFDVNNPYGDDEDTVHKRKCCCLKCSFFRNCCIRTFIDYDKFFSYLEHNHTLRTRYDSDSDSCEDDYEEVDLEASDFSPPNRPTRRYNYRTNNRISGNYVRYKSPFKRSTTVNIEKSDNESNDTEDDKKDISSNLQLVVAEDNNDIRRRSSSTHTDYESDHEY